MKTDVAATTLKAQYKECILQVKRAFPQARVLFTGILLRKKIPTDVVRGCNACFCNLCVEENIGFIPLSSDLQTAGGKTVRAKYFDGDGVHLNEHGVANMLRSIVAHIRQPATKAKDSLPQDKKAHPRRGRVTSRTLWSSVEKGVGAGSTEKGHDADDTLERAQCTVHATDGEMQQQRHKAVDCRGR